MTQVKKKNPDMKTDRLELFIDGVFVIAITLLLLEIKKPTHEQIHQYGGLYNYPTHISAKLSFIYHKFYGNWYLPE